MNNQHAEAIQREIVTLLTAFPELVEDEVLRGDMLEGVTNMQQFLSKLVQEIGEAKTLRDGTTERIDALKARRDRFKRRYEALRLLMQDTLEIANLRRFEMPEATLSIRPGPRKVICTVGPDELPDGLCRITREPDLEQIRKALLNGYQHDGIALSNGGTTLTINVR